MWEKEQIPDSSDLFCRVHRQFIDSKTSLPKESAFTNTPKDGDNLSADWDKYSTEGQCRDSVAKQFKFGKKDFKNPLDFFIFKFSVSNIRLLDTYPQEVQHDPLFSEPEKIGSPNNRAHSIIVGDKNDPELRLKLVDIGDWAISPFL